MQISTKLLTVGFITIFRIAFSETIGYGGTVPATDVVTCKKSIAITDKFFGSAYAVTGDGITDDTLAIQNALDYNVCDVNTAGAIRCNKPCSPPTYILFPAPTKAYHVRSLRLHANQYLIGTGRADSSEATIQGTGASSQAVIILDKLATNVTISHLSVASKGVPALAITDRSSGFNVEDSSFIADGLATGGTTAVKIVNSYRGNIERCYIAQIGAGWAMSLMDNANAVSIDNNIIAGSSAGNGIDIGQSQSVTVRENKFIEIMPGYGIRVAADVPGGGVTTGLTITGNYFEVVARPISLGEANQVAAATVSGNYVASYAHKDVTSNYFIFLGRVTASRVTQNIYGGAGKEPFVVFGYVQDPQHRKDVPEYIDDSVVGNNTIHGVKSYFSLSKFPVGGTQAKKLFKINQISFASDSQAH